MSCLFSFLRFAKETATTATWLVGLGFVRAFLVRLPPHNYSGGTSAFTTETGSLDESRSDTTLVNRSFDDSHDFVPEPEDIDDFFVCKKCRTSKEIDLATLQAASDRVSNILRERRQRVDAGQDPCAKRREARRRRTEELVLLAGAF